MNSEIEAKFLDVNFDDIREKLKALGADCEQPMRLMRRVTIENDKMISNNAYLRVRDEGHRVTMTYKQFDSLSVDGAKEIETVVEDFDGMVSILTNAGLAPQSYQESKRETWKLGDVEIVLDEWPWLKPYMEVEGPNEDSLKDVAMKLGFPWEEAVFGDVMVAYRAQYPHLTEKDTVGRISEVKFGDPVPALLQK